MTGGGSFRLKIPAKLALIACLALLCVAFLDDGRRGELGRGGGGFSKNVTGC